MDHRMSNYGTRIMSSYKPPQIQNSSYSHSPIKSQDNIKKLKDKVSYLNDEISLRTKQNKEAQIIGGLMSLIGTLSSNQNPPKKPETPPPVPTTTNQGNPEMGYLLQSFQRQQDMMFQFMLNMNQKKEKSKKKSKKNIIESNSIEETYKRIKKDPDGFRNILAELDFNDDGAEEYADKERMLKFSANLSEEEKAKILNQLEKNKIAKPTRGDYKLKGIRRFRMIGIIVLLPIFLVSNMLEKKAKFYLENTKYMQEQIEVFTEVTQAWVLKAIKTVLISTINDPELDLMLSNKESEVKSQQLNSRIIKLQVRINGIIEGLENITNETHMQQPFRSFFEKYISNKTFIPMNFLTPFEKSRLEFNEFGGLSNQSEDKKRMMICFFVITRTLIGEIFLKPIEAGIPVTKGSKTVV